MTEKEATEKIAKLAAEKGSREDRLERACAVFEELRRSVPGAAPPAPLLELAARVAQPIVDTTGFGEHSPFSFVKLHALALASGHVPHADQALFDMLDDESHPHGEEGVLEWVSLALEAGTSNDLRYLASKLHMLRGASRGKLMNLAEVQRADELAASFLSKTDRDTVAERRAWALFTRSQAAFFTHDYASSVRFFDECDAIPTRVGLVPTFYPRDANPRYEVFHARALIMAEHDVEARKVLGTIASSRNEELAPRAQQALDMLERGYPETRAVAAAKLEDP